MTLTGKVTHPDGSVHAPLSQPITELLTRKIDQPHCPWLSAAVRTGDDLVIRTVVHLHPAARCPAARRAA